MPMYRLWADSEGHTHIEAWPVTELAFESGPGIFKGIGGTILGAATRVALMRFEAGIKPPLHRVNGGLAVLMEGRLTVAVSDGDEVALAAGDAIRIESAGIGRGGIGGWQPVNPGPGLTFVALVQMPSKTPEGANVEESALFGGS